jgi:hypothetical protein
MGKPDVSYFTAVRNPVYLPDGKAYGGLRLQLLIILFGHRYKI